MVKKISQAEFKDAVGKGLSVVDFSATWCGPCQMLAPVMEKVSETFEGKINFFAIDVDEANALCQELGIMGVPAVFIFKDGNAVANATGFQPQQELENWINGNI